MLPGAGFLGGSPFALGSVFLTPQGALPTVTAAGTYDVLFDVGGSFCVTDDPARAAAQSAGSRLFFRPGNGCCPPHGDRDNHA